MLSNYNDAWFMNESLAFYMSTNIFRNPIFDNQLGQEENEIEDIGPPASAQAQSSNSSTPPPPPPTTTTTRITSLSVSQQQEQDPKVQQNGPAKRRFNKFRVSNYSLATKQKFNDFRDNLAFSIKGKIFVLELNFKRRLRRLRKFLNKNVPWILPRKETTRFAKENGGPTNDDDDICGGLNKQSGKYFPINQDVLFWKKVQPSSAKSLGVQQERLLSRLEKAKRDSHKLFNMDNNNFAGYFENDEEDPTEEPNINSLSGNVSSSHQMRRNRPTSTQVHPGSVDDLSGESLPDIVGESPSLLWGQSDKLTPKSRLVSFSLGEKALNRSLGVAGAAGWRGAKGKAKAKAAPMPAATSTTTTTTTSKIISSRAGKRKSRWISSGRQIRQAAFPFANSEKLCIVCYTYRANIVTLPCEHHDICSDCFIEIIYMAVKHGQYPLKCVLCRQKVERIRCSRRLLLKVIERNRTK